MKNNSNGIHLPFGYDTLITVILVITGAVFGYAKFVNKISELENNMQEANNKIEELISKHMCIPSLCSFRVFTLIEIITIYISFN